MFCLPPHFIVFFFINCVYIFRVSPQLIVLMNLSLNLFQTCDIVSEEFLRKIHFNLRVPNYFFSDQRATLLKLPVLIKCKNNRPWPYIFLFFFYSFFKQFSIDVFLLVTGYFNTVGV